MPKRTYRLPDYSTTHDENKWYRAWSSIWEPIEKALASSAMALIHIPGLALLKIKASTGTLSMSHSGLLKEWLLHWRLADARRASHGYVVMMKVMASVRQ